MSLNNIVIVPAGSSPIPRLSGKVGARPSAARRLCELTRAPQATDREERRLVRYWSDRMVQGPCRSWEPLSPTPTTGSDAGFAPEAARQISGRMRCPGPRCGGVLVLLISSCGARVREDLAVVVEEVECGATSAEGKVGGRQQRAVLRVAAEVRGRTWQVVAALPHTAVVVLFVLVAVLQRAEERIECRWRALASGR